MQTSYSNNPALGRAGLVADSRFFAHVASRIAEGRVKAGYGVLRVPGYGSPGGVRTADPGQVYQNPSIAIAVDADGIVTSIASSASIMVLDQGDVNGVLSYGDFFPARKLTLTLSSHADFDATTAVIRYINQDGATVSENMSIPNAGNATLTTTGYAREFIDLTIPAQSGTGGALTVGVAVLDTLTIADFVGVAVYDSAKVSADTTSLSAAEYEHQDSVPVMRKGAIWVLTEDTCVEGGDVYVRIASGASDQLGAFRSDADTAAAVQIVGAVWGRDSTAGTLNILEMY